MNSITTKFIQFLGYLIIITSISYSNYFSENTNVYAYILHIPSAILVGCGLLGFLLANNPFYQIIEIARCILKMSAIRLQSQMSKLSSVSNITEEYYQNGPKALLSHVDNTNIPKSWRSAFEKIAAKMPIADVKALVHFEYVQRHGRIDDSIYSLRRLSSISPSLGMFGTILGLIKLLNDLTDFDSIGSNMSLALITTLYGIFFSLAIIDPIVNKLDVYKVIRRKKILIF